MRNIVGRTLLISLSPRLSAFGSGCSQWQPRPAGQRPGRIVGHCGADGGGRIAWKRAFRTCSIAPLDYRDMSEVASLLPVAGSKRDKVRRSRSNTWPPGGSRPGMPWAMRKTAPAALGTMAEWFCCKSSQQNPVFGQSASLASAHREANYPRQHQGARALAATTLMVGSARVYGRSCSMFDDGFAHNHRPYTLPTTCVGDLASRGQLWSLTAISG